MLFTSGLSSGPSPSTRPPLCYAWPPTAWRTATHRSTLSSTHSCRRTSERLTSRCSNARLVPATPRLMTSKRSAVKQTRPPQLIALMFDSAFGARERNFATCGIESHYESWWRGPHEGWWELLILASMGDHIIPLKFEHKVPGQEAAQPPKLQDMSPFRTKAFGFWSSGKQIVVYSCFKDKYLHITGVSWCIYNVSSIVQVLIELLSYYIGSHYHPELSILLGSFGCLGKQCHHELRSSGGWTM